MAYLKNKALFFTTSPRTPSKMIPEIQLLGEHFSGCKWNQQTQVAFVDLLAESGFFEGSGSRNNKDFSARDRINRAPKALGFVDLSPRVELTDAGKALVYGKRPQEVFLRQLLKFQFPSPYHVETDNIKGTFCIKPYLEIMRLIRDLESLSFDELKIFALMLTDYRNYGTVKQAILDFRAEKEVHRGQYKKFVDEKWTDALIQTYSEYIDAGKTKTRETKDKSLKKISNYKEKQCTRLYRRLFSISTLYWTCFYFP